MPDNEWPDSRLPDLHRQADEFIDYGERAVHWIAAYLRAPERYPVLSRVQPGEIKAQLPALRPPRPKDGRHSRRLRHHPDARHHALEPSRFHGLFRQQRLGARRRGRNAERRAQRERHAVAHVARRHRTGRGRARLAGADARPAGRPARRDYRHGVDFQPARHLRRPRSHSRPGHTTEGLGRTRRMCRACACTARSRRTPPSSGRP